MSAAGGASPAGGGFRWTRVGDRHVAEWGGVLTAEVTPQGIIEKVTEAYGARPDVVAKVRRGLAAAFAHSIRGKPSLHAAAVALEDVGWLLLGPSGAGKSTIVAGLCAEPGATLLADDIANLDLVDGQWYVVPSETSVWLRSSGSDVTALKAPVSVQAARAPARLRGAMALRFDDTAGAPYWRRIAGARVAAAWLQAMVRFEVAVERMSRELEWTDAFARQFVVVELVRSRRSEVGEVCALARDLMGRVEWNVDRA